MVVEEFDLADKEITVADMKLLVTAVISFNSQQIVSAFLNVKRLKIALIDEISRPAAGSSSVVEQEGEDSALTTADVSMSDQLQSVFLRPDMPNRIKTTSSPGLLGAFNSPCKYSEADDYSVVTVKSLPSEPKQAMGGAALSSSAYMSKTASSHLSQSNKSQKNKKYGKLDELLRNHVGFSSFTKEANISRHVLCTKQVTHAVTNSSNHVSSNLHSASSTPIEQHKHRKRKSTAPRYIPWQNVSPIKQMVELHDISGVRSKSDSQSLTSDPYIRTPQTGTALAESSIIDFDKTIRCPSNTSSRTSRDARPDPSEPFEQFELFQHVTSNSTHTTTSVDNTMTSNELQRSQAASSVTDIIPLPQSKNRSHPSLYGPFITNSQNELGYDPSEYSLAPSEFTENMNDSIDFSSLIVGDPSLTYTLNDLSTFMDFPNSSTLDNINNSMRPARPKSKKKRSTLHQLNAKGLVVADADRAASQTDAPVAATGIIPLRLRCRRCNERFTSKTDYQLHLKSQVCSTGYAQTHTCQICGYCALTRQRLIVHMRTHSGERPHRCPFCSYAATQQAPLKRHIQNIHMKQGAISLTSTGHGDQPPPKQVDQRAINTPEKRPLNSASQPSSNPTSKTSKLAGNSGGEAASNTDQPSPNPNSQLSLNAENQPATSSAGQLPTTSAVQAPLTA